MTKMNKRRSQFNSGDIFAIPLGDDYFSFCVACVGNEFIFFAHQTLEPEIPKSLLELPIAFRVLLGKGEPKEGGWLLIGNIELPSHLTQKTKFLHKPVGAEGYFIYLDGESNPATEEEVRHLELFTVWYAEDVVERLNEHFNGQECSTTSAIKKQLGIPF
ncbi:MAG: hypothetical protein ACWA5R_13230 [bacterium]